MKRFKSGIFLTKKGMGTILSYQLLLPIEQQREKKLGFHTLLIHFAHPQILSTLLLVWLSSTL